jgi:HD-GYP domain-containing protein (c-di-GMP phosphodiesterase class II)
VAAAPVRHPGRPELDLLMPGVALDERIIAALRRFGIPALYVRWPSLDFLDDVVSTHVRELRDDVFASLKTDFEQCQSLTVGVGQYLQYREVVSRMIVGLLSQQGSGAGVETASLYDHGVGLFSHSANVTYLSLTLALRLEHYVSRQRVRARHGRDMTNLGIGAMLHDIGKTALPSTQEMHEPLLEPPTLAYREHPRRGFAMIRERISATARAVVLHHHQRFDGTGFPDMESINGVEEGRTGALRGEEIHIFARIVAVCDALEHLCHDDQGRPRPVVAALHDLLSPRLAGRFDPVVLLGLLVHVPAFAIGTHVKLSDDSSAAVVAFNRRSPCRPVVRRLECDDPLKRNVDLSGEMGVHIRESLGVNVEKWLFDLPAGLVTQSVPA